MAAENQPLVSVVMPVYNGEEFIADAIRSVQAQTYSNWQMFIGNNWSKDGTLAITESFAAQDPRIHVVTYPKFVSVVESHNNAFRLVAPEAKYCKLISADDLLFPSCIEEMVKVAEAYPSVGMVVSYVLAGNHICSGFPYPTNFMSGREVVRRKFLVDSSPLGGPSQSLIRASILRERDPFYNPINYHGDIEAYLELLKTYDLGFVHQLLTFMRTGDASRTTSYLGRVQSRAASRMDELTKFGPFYLTEEEFAPRLREATNEYYDFLGANVWEFRKKEFWDYHLQHVKKLGYPPKYPRIVRGALVKLIEMAGNPLRTIQGALRRVRARRARSAPRPGASHGPAPTTRASTATR